VSLSVFSASGRMVKSLVQNSRQTTGLYAAEWNAAARSGVYLFVLKANNSRIVRKIAITE